MSNTEKAWLWRHPFWDSLFCLLALWSLSSVDPSWNPPSHQHGDLPSLYWVLLRHSASSHFERKHNCELCLQSVPETVGNHFTCNNLSNVPNTLCPFVSHNKIPHLLEATIFLYTHTDSVVYCIFICHEERGTSSLQTKHSKDCAGHKQTKLLKENLVNWRCGWQMTQVWFLQNTE